MSGLQRLLSLHQRGQMPRTVMRVVLFGMKHCGKSTLAAKLARRWSCPCYDTDLMMEQRVEAKSKEKLSVRDIYRQYGDERFAELEHQVVLDLLDSLQSDPGTSYVVALGGRTPLRGELSPRLKELGLNVFLKVDANVLWDRVERGGIPAFLTSEDPKGEFFSLYSQRLPLYEAQAELTVSLDALSLEEALEKLAQILEARDGR